MESKKVTPEMRAELRKPLPEQAVKPNPSKTYLSTIKPIFVTERLNDVFGVGSWQIRTELVNPINAEAKTKGTRNYTDFTALMKTVLTIPEYGIYYECIAGSTNEDEGDSAKGGTTDGITKICSWLEIGINVFKGLGNIATEPTVNDAVNEYLAVKSREEATDVWNKYKQFRNNILFQSAAKAMAFIYPKTEDKEKAS